MKITESPAHQKPSPFTALRSSSRLFIRHVEEMLQEVTTWEDYDDDEPTKRIGFKFNFGQKSEPGIALEAEDQ